MDWKRRFNGSVLPVGLKLRLTRDHYGAKKGSIHTVIPPYPGDMMTRIQLPEATWYANTSETPGYFEIVEEFKTVLEKEQYELETMGYR